MPGYAMNESKGGDFGKNLEGYDYVPGKEIFSKKSPTSPLSTHSLALSTMSYDSDILGLIADRKAAHSIEQLYHNICEMESSDGYSSSGRSFYSYGQESRIDSELRFLAGGDYGEASDEHYSFEEEKRKKGGILEDSSKSISSLQTAEVSQETTLRKKAFHGRPPTGKPNVGGLKRWSDASSVKNECFYPFSGKIRPSPGQDRREARYLGPYLLKQARNMMATGNTNAQRALELALRAVKSFEYAADAKPNLEFVMCLHVVGALYCRLGRHTEAIPFLERSIEMPVIESGMNHALAKFSGCMQLGDVYAMHGKVEKAIIFYKAGLEIQCQALGRNDFRCGETCRYIAEAHVQLMQFQEAEEVCSMALDIHKENNTSSVEELSDRRLLGHICDSQGKYEGSLKHYILARMIAEANGQIAEVAALECNIGDAYLSLSRYDEAIFAYQKALMEYKFCKGENHSLVASVFVCLADLCNKMGDIEESKSYCVNALEIYYKPSMDSLPEEIASGLAEISAIYESMNEPNRALLLLEKATELYDHNAPGYLSIVAGIEAQMGMLHYILGSYLESYNCFKKAILKFRATGEMKSAVFGMVLNQLGLVCVQQCLVNEAADSFEQARSVLEAVHGLNHSDTLRVCINLANTYDAMCRTDDAIEVLQHVANIREKLEARNSDVECGKNQLSVLLKEKERVKKRHSNSLPKLDTF